ncbi:hypothetical protein SAMN05444680_116104 [Variovorax sp. YR216]|nr:hypothetical protein SAMN05444680_116104 [Variovorax sp. YR216]
MHLSRRKMRLSQGIQEKCRSPYVTTSIGRPSGSNEILWACAKTLVPNLAAGVSSLLAGAQSQASALQQRLEDLERQLGEERKAHEDTRGLLAGALADVRGAETPPRKATVRRGKGAPSSSE